MIVKCAQELSINERSSKHTKLKVKRANTYFYTRSTILSLIISLNRVNIHF